MNQRITDLEQELNKKDGEISELKVALKERDIHIKGLEGKNFRLKAYLNMIKSTVTWKLMMSFHNLFVERFLSRGTKRRILYEWIINRLRRYLNRGKKTSRSEGFQRYLVLDKNQLEKQRKTGFPLEPEISVIVPTYNTREEFLVSMIESVKNQTYPKWELCIADGRSTKPHVKRILESYTQNDKRIKVKFLRENKGISGNSNEALSIATGDFIALLDHDDTLTPNALYEVVKAINENPDVHFIYSDYAMTDEDDNIQQAVFCPDFCRFFYLSHPYLVHLIVMRKSILEQVGAFDEVVFDKNVSQDVDLFLRIFAVLEDRNIFHIPRILYLWKHYGSSARHLFQDKVHKFTKIAIERYLTSKNLDGWVEDGLSFNNFRIRLKIKDNPLISIIIPTRDNWKLLERCMQSIETKSGYDNYEIIIVKNNTEDTEALQYLESLKYKHKLLEYNSHFNYSAINNYAVKSAQGEYLLFLNDDIELKEHGSIRAVVELLQSQEVGAVGAKLLYPDETIQHAGVIIGLYGFAEHWHKFTECYFSEDILNPGYITSLVSIREYSAVTGAFLMTKKSVFNEVGGFSEELEVGFNDIDYCLNVISKGYKILYTPYAVAYHFESASRSDPNNEDLLLHPKDRRLFIEKWKHVIEKGDPCYNPNLDTYSYNPQSQCGFQS